MKKQSNRGFILTRRIRKADRTPLNIKSRGSWGGKREGSGRPQRKPSPLPENMDLASTLGLDRFLRHIIENTCRENVLDARLLSALNGTVKMLLELRGWIRPWIDGLDDPVEGGSESDSVSSADSEKTLTPEDIAKMTPDQRLDQLLKWKKELEDAGVPCSGSVDIPDIDELAASIKTLSPEDKARLIEFCKQRGTPDHIRKRLGLEADEST